jgi:hypothetical protein
VGVAIDTAVICLFAAVGRRSHGETSALVGVAATAWPFLAGMTAGWLVALLAFGRAPLRLRDGIPVWLGTVAIGMLLRSLTHSGTAPSFIVVATLFLGLGLLGWRARAGLVHRPAPAGEH